MAEPRKKKALLITYRFPPYGGGGVQRALKFTKYLGEFGWDPVVLTSRDPYWPIVDETLVAQIPPGVRVYKTAALEFERFEKRLTDALKGMRNGSPGKGGAERSSGAGPAAASVPDEAAAQNGAGGGGLRFLRDSVHRRLLIPDAQIAWLPGAFLRAVAVGRREGVEVVFTTSPPNSIHLLGRLVAAALGKPWVADFRDPWTDGARRRRAYENNRLRRRIEQMAERAVVRAADRVIVTAEPLRDRFLGKYSFLEPDKIELLTNGYDPDDFGHDDEGTSLLEPGRFHLTGTGNIEAMFDARPLFQAIAEVVAEDEDLRRDLVVNLVGARRGKYDDQLRELGLTERVRYPGWVPHRQSLRFLRESQVLLMCAVTQTSGRGEKYPAKGFEYLYARKPVLCLSVPGTTTELLAQSGLGTVVHPSDVAGIKRALKTFYQSRERPLRGDDAFIQRFDRRLLTGHLAGIFDALAGARPSAS